MPRTTVKIEAGLLERLRERAHRHRTTLQDELNAALRLGLAQEERQVEPLRFPGRIAGPRGVDLANRELLLEVLDQT